VYKAYHIYLKTPWALKVVSSLKSLAENELTVLKSLNHHAFPRLVDVITDDSYNILVFDYYEGPTLQSLLQANGSIEVERVYKWALQILDALSYLHSHNPEPIIYRDLKPSNLIISKNDNIKLIDFGTARHFKHENTDDTVYLGTPGYAAPEQYGFGQTDVRTDIYNFGMTIIHLITH
jgi:serine/threonine protein kinase